MSTGERTPNTKPVSPLVMRRAAQLQMQIDAKRGQGSSDQVKAIANGIVRHSEAMGKDAIPSPTVIQRAAQLQMQIDAKRGQEPSDQVKAIANGHLPL